MARATLTARQEVARVWRLGRRNRMGDVRPDSHKARVPFVTRRRPIGQSWALVFPMPRRVL